MSSLRPGVWAAFRCAGPGPAAALLSCAAMPDITGLRTRPGQGSVTVAAKNRRVGEAGPVHARGPVASLAVPLRPEQRVAQFAMDAQLRARGIDPRGPMQLEIWPNDMREMPNDYARSALFTVRNKTEPRASMQGTLVFHVERAVRITFTGIELRADDDELVWQQLLDYAKAFPLGEPVEFNLHQLCSDLNWSVNGRNYDKLRACISRLKANEVKVESERLGRGVAISLIREYEFVGDGERGTKYRIWIHANLIHLFAGNTSTRIAWAQYRELPPISRRLYDYFASHRKPFPLRLDTFQKMCASTCSSPRKWRSMVRAACSDITAAQLVRGAWVHEECVFCER